MASLVATSAVVTPAPACSTSKRSEFLGEQGKNGRVSLWSKEQRSRVAGGLKVEAAISREGAESQTIDVSRREAVLSGVAALVGGLSLVPAALADFEEDYKKETQTVIEQVKGTLTLEKNDPSKSDAVAALRETSNAWVAKYRREKNVAGRPSFSNMYSVLNAISGHYISFGPNVAIPGKRKDRIFEEISTAEKALSRGR